MRISRKVAIVIAIGIVPQLAYAQPSKPAASQTAQADSGEARKRYDIGLKLYDENNWEAARIEFERAYELNPSYRILYNIGLVYRQLNNYTASLSAFERYLAEGTDITPERHAEVQKEITELSTRIGRVRVTTSVSGAEVLVDDLPVGKAPMAAPLRVNPGIRKFTVQAQGHLPTSKTLSISTGDNPELKLVLVELPKSRLEKSNPWVVPTIAGWSATGLALGGTIVTGILALNAQSDQDAMRTSFGATRAQQDDARDKTTTLAGVNNALLAGTLLFGGLSTYFTLKLLGWTPSKDEDVKPDTTKPRAAQPGRFAVGPAGLGVGAIGTF